MHNGQSPTQYKRWNSLLRTPSFSLVIVLLLLFGGLWNQLRQAFALNLAARTTLLALSVAPNRLGEATVALAKAELEQDCRADWLRGLVANTLGETTYRDISWKRAISCSPNHISSIRIVLGEDPQWAELAVRVAPENAESWFWLANARSTESPEEAIRFYRQGLQIDPSDAKRWRQLGDLLRERDPRSAIEAYFHACINGDPGNHGCWSAGQLAEQGGDIDTAIRYYRLSDWSRALERARQLEQRQVQRDP